jgi:hypothetical protein
MSFKQLLQEKKTTSTNKNNRIHLGFYITSLPEREVGITIKGNTDAEKNTLNQPISRLKEGTDTKNTNPMLSQKLNKLQPPKGCVASSDIPDISLDQLENHISIAIDKAAPYLDPCKAYAPTDAEWDAVIKERFSNWIQSSTILIYPYEGQWQYHVFLFTSKQISKISRDLIKTYFDRDWITLIDADEGCQLEGIEDYLESKEVKVRVIQLIVKFSALDLHSYFGNDIWIEEILKNGLIEQKRCLRFNNKKNSFSKRRYKPSNSKYKYEIRDIQGLNNNSLEVQALSVGVQLLAKKSMDAYKTKMFEGYHIKPLTATMYNLCDTIANFEITMAYIPLINEIITDVIGLPEHCKISESGLRHTTGSVEGDFKIKYIEYFPYVIDKNVSEDNLDTWRLALRRYSILKSDLNTEGSKLGGLIIEGFRKCSKLEDFKNYKIKFKKGKKEVEDTLYNLILHPDKALFDSLAEYKTYEQCCIRFLGSDLSNTKVFGALVQGGRCNNSFPYESYLEWVLDIDFTSAYGSTLRSLEYPIGLPSSIQSDLSEGSKLPLFKKTYDKLAKNLENNLWCADVITNDKLNFDIDLIYSTLNVSPEKINKSVGSSHYDDEGFEVTDDVKKIPSDFALVRNEIEHGKLTSSTLEVIEKVASNTEKSDLWKKLEVNSFIYYSKKDKIDDPIEWAKKVLKDKGGINQDTNNDKYDTRSRAWFPLPLEHFIGKLVDRRNKVKKEMKGFEVGTAEYYKLNAFQEMLKLLINTEYGDLASVYFTFGNAVLANVITDKARCGAWMLSKPLRTREEITDGGFYTPTEVAFIRGIKKPGFHILSDARRWAINEGGAKRTLEPMAGFNWKEIIEERKRLQDILENSTDKKEKYKAGKSLKRWEIKVDKLALEHINNFWSLYGLELPFSIEHKFKNTAYEAGYINKSDYCFRLLNGKYEIKKRGSKKLSEYQLNQGLIEDPAFKLLEKLSHNDTTEYENTPYNVSHIIKIGEWIEAREDSEIKKLYPGQEIISSREPRQMNNKHIYICSKDMHEKIKKRKGLIRGERAIWYERYIREIDKYLQKINNNVLD